MSSSTVDNNNNNDNDDNDDNDDNEERPWVDAWIRWPEDDGKGVNKKSPSGPHNDDNDNDDNDNDDNDNDNDDDSDNDLPLDPFASDPRQTFLYEATLSTTRNTTTTSRHHDDIENQTSTIHVELQGFHDDSDQSWNSTGLTLWRASRHLCDYLVQHPTLVVQQRTRICELGAGLGLVGIVAHQIIAVNMMTRMQEPQDTHSTTTSIPPQVIVTDGDTDALKHLRLNLKRHQPDSTTSSKVNILPTLEGRQLLWGKDPTRAFLRKYYPTHNNDNNPPFQLLLASDVVYVDTILQPLFETVELLLDKHEGIFLFAYCSRRQVPVTMDMVLEQAHRAGFVETLLQEQDGIFIYQFQWNDEKEQTSE